MMKHALTRIDMSEYMEKHTVSRLIGAPPGYVGYDQGGQLTEAVRRRPYSVILFDEIEKAHTDVFNVMLQLLDDGRLTDGQGRIVDFKNTIIIMTSNLGSEYILQMEDLKEAEAAVSELLRSKFKPEFLNRIDEIIMFNRLGKDEIHRIVDIEIGKLVSRLKVKKYDIEITDSAKQLLADLGYDPAFGARPLKRTIQNLVQNPLAKEILKGTFVEGDVIKISSDGDSVLFTKK